MTYEETKLSVIIVNYNVKYFLEQCLYSVRAAVTGMDAEVHRGIRVIAESRYRGGRGEPPQPVLPNG